jgi:thiol-disulfide isomerase/thioredoxin
MKSWFPYLFIGLAIAGFYWYRYRTAHNLQWSKIEVEALDGSKSTLDKLTSGHATLLHFYATWCGPCMKEMREIKRQIPQIGSKVPPMILLTDDSLEKIGNMSSDLPKEISVYKINSLKNIGIHTIPTTYLLDKNGEIIWSQVDPCNWDDPAFLQKINDLLNS